MQVWQDRYKREGLIGTIVFHVLLFLLFLYVGLPYMVPKPEQGITVNFGTSMEGSGEIQPETAGEPVNNPTQDPQPDPTPVEPTPPVDAPEDVVTQDDTDAPEVQATEKPNPEKPKEKPVEEPKEEPKPEQTISSKLNNALDRFKQSSSQSGGSEGDDADKSGDKGQINGTKDSGAYTGGGSGDGNYQLGNRKALSRPKPNYTCQEEGRVVIDIRVDRNGKTLKASVGKGTTNTAECLTQQAIQAALKTKWQPNPDAPIEQIGKITYQFILK